MFAILSNDSTFIVENEPWFEYVEYAETLYLMFDDFNQRILKFLLFISKNLITIIFFKHRLMRQTTNCDLKIS